MPNTTLSPTRTPVARNGFYLKQRLKQCKCFLIISDDIISTYIVMSDNGPNKLLFDVIKSNLVWKFEIVDGKGNKSDN